MTAGRWKAIEALFNQVVELPDESRDSWLREACRGDEELLREVQALIEVDRGGAVAASVKQAVTDLHDSKKLENLRIGPYRLIEEIGRGGMGSVYRASRADDAYQSEVAIKLVRQGMDTEFVFNRFLRERQVLARLRHPNIAQLLDGGHTDSGVPYIVMEYIRGRMIHDYCEHHSLSVPARLRLFLDVCAAVEYSHRSFVIHRDLKPSNILVDESGSPKLLDFGICKLLYDAPDLTQGAQLLTPDYASPEQVRAEAVGVASDVYSLGAVLYTVLTGRKPHDFAVLTPVEIERVVCEQDVRKPSEAAKDRGVARRLEGDLDTIILKAMEKEPNRRYRSVEQFAEDIRRHLDLLPIVARPDTLFYRASKFTRRHKGGMAAGAAIALSLIVGLVASQREAARANQRLHEVRRLSNAMLFDVHDAIRDLPGATGARKIIVDRAVEYLDKIAIDVGDDAQFLLELAAAYERIGDVQGNVLAANLGKIADGLASYRKSAGLLDEAIAKGAPASARAARMRVARRIADGIGYLEGPAAGLAALRPVVEQNLEAEGRFAGDRELTSQLAELLLASSRLERTSENFEPAAVQAAEALRRFEQLAAAEPSNTDLRQAVSAARAAAGAADATLGKLDSALVHYRKGVDIAEQIAAGDPTSVAARRGLMLAYAHVGDVLGNPRMSNLGDLKGAAEAYGKMLTLARSMRDVDPADVRSTADFAIALGRMANVTPAPAERLKLLAEASSILHRQLAANPKNRNLVINMAFIELLAGQAEEQSGSLAAAEAAYRRGYETLKPLPSSDAGVPRSLAELASGIGRVAARQGREAEAIEWARRTREIGANPALVADPAVSRKALRPRSIGLEAGIYEALSRKIPAYRDEAVKRRAEALAYWRGLAGSPGFVEEHRRAMKELETQR